MNNYEYLISSLPLLTPEWRYSGDSSFGDILSEIRRDCSARDNELVDFLLEGFDADNLDSEFYSRALSHRNRFIREYFRFDINLRNAKVGYLNSALGRPAGTDEISGTDEEGEIIFDGGEFEEEPKVRAILAGSDILARERGLDDVLWAKIDELTVFDYFDIEAVLGFIAKLHIIDRWFILDEESGRDMFRRLVDEVRGTFGGVRYDGSND